MEAIFRTMTIKIIRPFRYIQAVGDYKPAVVAYGKKPWQIQSLESTENKKEIIVMQFLYFLYINLYFVELEFNWISD